MSPFSFCFSNAFFATLYTCLSGNDHRGYWALSPCGTGMGASKPSCYVASRADSAWPLPSACSGL